MLSVEQGCDGAHSTVRRSLGYKMIGDSTDAVWGVMDVYPQSNFPDIRKKVTLHTKSGNLMVCYPLTDSENFITDHTLDHSPRRRLTCSVLH